MASGKKGQKAWLRGSDLLLRRRLPEASPLTPAPSARGQQHVLDPDLRPTPDTGGEAQRPTQVLGNLRCSSGPTLGSA